MTSVNKSIQCAREVAILLPQISYYIVRDGLSNSPSFSTVISYCLDRCAVFESTHGEIDARILMEKSKSAFNIPDYFNCSDRYECKLRCSQALLDQIDAVTERLAKKHFAGRVYRNFAVRYLLRAVVAIEEGFCPVVNNNIQIGE